MGNSSPRLMIEGAEALLAASESFRLRVGAANPANAKHQIHFSENGLGEDVQKGQTLSDKRPFAIIGLASHDYTQISQGAQIDLGAMGGTYIVFVDNPSDPKDPKRSYLDFLDWIGSCIEDIADLVGSDGYFPFSAISLIIDPKRPNVSARKSDDYWLAAYVLTFSVNGGGVTQ